MLGKGLRENPWAQCAWGPVANCDWSLEPLMPRRAEFRVLPAGSPYPACSQCAPLNRLPRRTRCSARIAGQAVPR